MFYVRLLKFLKQLKIEEALPEGVQTLNPFQDKIVLSLCEEFYKKYYNDENIRTLILGINPGRHGGGLTGIPFTDPIKLEQYCGIANPLPKKPELSADFIYRMITAYGGPDIFYRHFHFSSISPLGFTLDGKNLNYYDINALQHALRPFIVDSMKKTLKLGISTSVCYCLGEGTNVKYLHAINKEFGWFETIVPLAHPRFIMQYRRKLLDTYVGEYVEKLKAANRR